MTHARYAIGFHLRGAGGDGLLVELRRGTVLATCNGPVGGAAVRSLLRDADVAVDRVIAGGIAADESSDDVRSSIAGVLPKNAAVAVAPAAYAAVAGAGVASPSTVVLWVTGGRVTPVMNSRVEAGVAGVKTSVDAILPGYFGYEMPAVTIDPDDAEATALRLRDGFDALQQAGVHVRRFVVAGEMSPRLLQALANVLTSRVKLAASPTPAALGAAALGAIAAGVEASGHASMSQLVHAIAHQRQDIVYRPDLAARKKYAR